MRDAKEPLSGGALGKETGVSRQVVVQDIALLRTQGYPIVATARGISSMKAIKRFVYSKYTTAMNRLKMN